MQGRKWHAGVEGRISVLKRAHGLGRCLNHGLPGFERWIGWGVIATNLAVMGQAQQLEIFDCQGTKKTKHFSVQNSQERSVANYFLGVSHHELNYAVAT